MAIIKWPQWCYKTEQCLQLFLVPKTIYYTIDKHVRQIMTSLSNNCDVTWHDGTYWITMLLGNDAMDPVGTRRLAGPLQHAGQDWHPTVRAEEHQPEGVQAIAATGKQIIFWSRILERLGQISELKKVQVIVTGERVKGRLSP